MLKSMEKFKGLASLVASLPALDGRVFVLHRVYDSAAEGHLDVLIDAVFLVLTDDEEPRTLWAHWYDIDVLMRVPWAGRPASLVLEEGFRPHAVVGSAFDGSFSEANVPASAAIPALESEEARLHWWALAPLLCAWEHRGTASIFDLAPTARIDIVACESRIGVELPDSLSAYLQELGTSSTVEEILSVHVDSRGGAIEPLLNAYPGILEMFEEDSDPVLQRMRDLIAFGSYLGNGNYWCFDRINGAVWYFDHDGPVPLTRMFDSPGEYFDALTIVAIGHAHEILGGENEAEKELVERLGSERVRTWMY